MSHGRVLFSCTYYVCNACKKIWTRYRAHSHSFLWQYQTPYDWLDSIYFQMNAWARFQMVKWSFNNIEVDINSHQAYRDACIVKCRTFISIMGKMAKWCSMEHKGMDGEKRLFVLCCPLFGTIHFIFGFFQWDGRNRNNSWNQIILRIWFTCGMQFNKKARAAATAIPAAAQRQQKLKTAAATASAVTTAAEWLNCWRNQAMEHESTAKKHQEFRAVPIFVRSLSCWLLFLFAVVTQTYFLCAYTQSYTLMHSRVLCVLCAMNECSLPLYDFDRIHGVYYVCIVKKGRKRKKNDSVCVCVCVNCPLKNGYNASYI